MTWNGRPYQWVGDWSARRRSLSPDREALVDVTGADAGGHSDASTDADGAGDAADADPDAVGERYTYADLDRRANRTARLLADRGVADGERVAVLSRNRVEVFDLFFATGKTGGVLAPLSHRLAPREIGELLDLVEPRLLVVEAPFADLAADALAAAEVDPDVLGLPADGEGGRTGDPPAIGGTVAESYADARPADDAPVDGTAVALDDPHLLLHTGGSTGTPKETTITHGGIAWNSLNTIASWGLRPDDVTPMVFPTFHTGGWNVITIPLFHLGGTVVIDREVDPGRVLEVVDGESATVLVAVPAVLRMMATHDRWDGTDLSSLRFVKSGGGPCRESVIAAWRDRGVDLSQGYGLTECGPNNFAMPDDWPPEKVASVGKPALHVDARIVGDDGAELPPGEIGELELAGQHAAADYWRNPEETAATFGPVDDESLDDADGSTAARRWVSTGDLARIDEDGYYHIEGRKKNMFVSGGENVYPPKVEDAIADHPAVSEVVVVGVPDEQWGTVGKAVVELVDDADAVPEGDAADLDDPPLTLAALESFLEDRLAGFEIPAHLAFVDEMPTSGPSKIDRQAIEERFGEPA